MRAKTRNQGNVKLIAGALAFVFLVIGIFVGNSISGYYVYQVDMNVADLPSTSTDGFTEVGISIAPMEILLTGSCRRMSVMTSAEQIASIDLAIRRMEAPRPLAHDIITNEMKVFGIEVLMVKIHSLEDGIYYSNIIFRQNNKVLQMDSKPSDAVAIALRMNAPVYVSDDLLKAEGKAVC